MALLSGEVERRVTRLVCKRGPLASLQQPSNLVDVTLQGGMVQWTPALTIERDGGILPECGTRPPARR
jgi:hypothetical protein